MAGKVMLNFYNSALSLFNAYKDRVVADGGVLGDNTNFGPELVTNGGFDTDTGWTKGSNWNISGGTANCNGGLTAITYIYPTSVIIRVGKKYKVTLTISNYTSGTCSVLLEGGTVRSDSYSSDGTFTCFLTSTTVGHVFISCNSGTFIGSIDNCSVVEVLGNSITAYIKLCKLNNMYNSIKLGWLGVGGNLAIGTNNVKKLYSITPQGTEVLDTIEKVANGGFDTDTIWSKGIGITISGGTANYLVSSAVNLNQPNVLTVGKQYKIVFEISNYASGVILLNPTTGVSTPRKNNGMFSETFVATSTTLWIMTAGAASLSLDNVSIKEVLSGDPLDLSSVGNSSYPYYLGTIAPNENPYIKNTNEGLNYLLHPTINFTDTDAWSITTLVNAMTFRGVTSNFYVSDNSSGGSLFGIDNASSLKIRNSLFTVKATTKKVDFLIGKNAIITIIAKGDNTLDIFINGVLFETISIITSINLSCLMTAVTNQTPFKGSIAAHIIRSQALTPVQVLTESNFIKNLYPDIPNVTIGTQQWQSSNCEMTCTPQGNLINNVTINSNTEKIVNGTMEGAYVNGVAPGWFSTRGNTSSNIIDPYEGTSSQTITNIAGNTGVIYQYPATSIGLWYKISFYAKNTKGTGGAVTDSSISLTLFTISSTDWTLYTMMYKAPTANLGLSFYANRDTITDRHGISFDSVSVQQIGRSGAKELYDAIYGQTTGTITQKTYEAVKAAAMWCYYNNDASIGAVYGKLYNWFAVKLLQMDIDYYNDTNPTTPWGWKVPTQTDFTALSTTLGGDDISGGKLKKEGLSYWNTPNIGADNSSGFSALGSGGTDAVVGTFSGLTGDCGFYTVDKYVFKCNYANGNLSSVNAALYVNACRSLRLIKV